MQILFENEDVDIVITEIGGTVGDIESQPFLEAIRQISIEHPEDCCFIHVTLVPYISGSNEYKSKPTQHSVKELQNMGVRPNIIIPRCDGKLPQSVKEKISLFCNVKQDCVIENTTVADLYEAPVMLEKQNFSAIVCRELNLEAGSIDLSEWNIMLERIYSAKDDVNIALVGKYVALHDAYLSVVESLKHGGYETGARVHIKWVESEDITEESAGAIFRDVQGIIVPGGFGDRGIEGMIEACKYAREHNIPYFGICLGMQIATIEFARNVLGYKDANSSEFDKNSTHKVIDFIHGQSDEIDKGGTMRLGAYPCHLQKDTKLSKLYGVSDISERHRHRYEFNNEYLEAYEKAGMTIAGINPDAHLVEAVENDSCDFFVGVQFHPEFKSRPNKAHPVFRGFIAASLAKK